MCKLYLSVIYHVKTKPKQKHVKHIIGTPKFMMPNTINLMDELMKQEN